MVETLDRDYRYSEEPDSERAANRSVCSLYRGDDEEPVSSLSIVAFRLRFGGAAVRAEGIGDVRTLPQHRQQGNIGRLINRALAGMRSRVDVAFLYGIQDLYGKFGFVSCLRESRLTIWTGTTARIALPPQYRADTAQSDDWPSIIDLYNDTHRLRAWTAVRASADARRFEAVPVWRAGTNVLVLRRSGAIVGYAALPGARYGVHDRQLTVIEAAAVDMEAATVLLGQIGTHSEARRVAEFAVQEPQDTMIGRAAMRIGCSQSVDTHADGGGMGLLLNRSHLVRELTEELERRVSDGRRWIGDQVMGRDTAEAAGRCIDMLERGEIVPNDGDLLRLLLAHWSFDDAVLAGANAPAELMGALRTMFPGGGVPWLPTPYSHRLDRY